MVSAAGCADAQVMHIMYHVRALVYLSLWWFDLLAAGNQLELNLTSLAGRQAKAAKATG